MMKNGFATIYKTILAVVLYTLIICSAGCEYAAQPGETAAEGHRRHLRNLSINQQSMMGDIDRAALAEKPSTATPQKIE